MTWIHQQNTYNYNYMNSYNTQWNPYYGYRTQSFQTDVLNYFVQNGIQNTSTTYFYMYQPQQYNRYQILYDREVCQWNMSMCPPPVPCVGEHCPKASPIGSAIAGIFLLAICGCCCFMFKSRGSEEDEYEEVEVLVEEGHVEEVMVDAGEHITQT
mmetsp:Transcript_1300/g.1615  ORF Transcript_1300/g.1615 Transcript_1300/m.1615 type:complete len:155 (-) Transcript_1300:370-834(-)